MNWTQEQIAGVPLEVILNHPALRQAAGTISQQLPSGQATQTTMAYPPATFPNIPMPPPPSGSSNSNQALSPGSDDQIPTGSSASNVGGDGMTEAQRRCLRWTKEDAKKVHLNFGKKDILVNNDGSPISEEEMTAIETDIRQECLTLNDYKIPAYQDKMVRNFKFWSSRHLHLLIKICDSVEARHPALKKCSQHYKALKCIELHLKAKLTTQRKDEATHSSSSSSTIPTPLPSKQSSPVKKRNASTSPDVQVKKPKITHGKKSTLINDSVIDDEFADADDSDTGTTAIAPGTSRQMLSNISNTKDPSFREPDANKLQAPSRQESSSSVTAPSSDLPSLVLPQKPSNEDTTADVDRSVPRKKIIIPTRPPTISDDAPLSSMPRTLPPSAISAAVADIVAEDSAQLVQSTVVGLQNSLDSRYSALDSVCLSNIQAAVDSLRRAVSCGPDPKGDGDEEYRRWLSGLEAASPPDEEDDDREDKMGATFGHNEIGKWNHHEALRDIKTYGSIKNALRLLAALLRIWAMAKEQLRQAGSKPGPIVVTHLSQVSNLIVVAFALTVDVSNVEKEATEAGPSEKPATAKKLAEPPTADKKPRVRVKKLLDNGIVDETVVKSLSKKACLTLCELGGIEVRSKAKVDEFRKALTAAMDAGKIEISATQLRQAKGDLPVEGTIKSGDKGKRKALS